MKPVVIGITGKACAGKNQYAKAFEELGARLIDVDRLGHQALEANKDRIIAEFGDSVADRGEIDRKALGAIVFSDPTKLKVLEGISHPWMVARIERILAEETAEVIVLNAALLSRMGLDRLCSHILFIAAPRCLRFRRCKARDG
ncbi:MAG TPA: dephospho-CoA kinase, partial [Sphaerochaeta sp.]|nr:dephospho-CoA kinase [Sphaerochaeta sp.]